MKKLLLTLFLFVFAFPNLAMATIGVGVGTGKIKIEDKLKPGIIYELPPLTVLNTGTEPSDYEVSISYFEKQPELMPKLSWFMFSPQTFHLDPGQSQVVNVKINLPVNTVPGDYFAYLEGHPVKKVQSGINTVGVAAAAKLYFTVVPTNIFNALYYKMVSIFNIYAPWPQIATGVVLFLVAVRIFSRFFNLNLNIGLKRKMPAPPHSATEDKDKA